MKSGRAILIAMALVVSGLVIVPGVTQAPYTNVAITLTNSQTTGTPNPMQVRINVSASTYTSVEKSDMGNVRFSTTDDNSAPLYSWLESCSNATCNLGSADVFWVKLTFSIASSSTHTIYMIFLPIATAFDGNQAGQNPELGSAGDNGANVFTYYTSFPGSSLPSGWSVATIGADGYSVSNGLTITPAGSGDGNILYHAYVSGGNVTDFKITANSGSYFSGSAFFDSAPTNQAAFGIYTSAGSSFMYDVDYHSGSPYIALYETSSGSSFNRGTSSITTTSPRIYTATFRSSSYTQFTSAYSTSGVAYALGVVTYPASYFGMWGYSGTGASTTFRWMRTRANPPAQVMPSASFGSLTVYEIVITVSATSIGATTATLNGNLTDLGGYTDPQIGFYYDTTSTPSNGINVTVGTASSPQSFSYAASSLLDGHTYYFQAWAGGGLFGAKFSVGSILTFDTPALATVTTGAATNIAATTVTLNGVDVSTGDCSVTHWGFQWSTHANMSGYTFDLSGPSSNITFTMGGNYHDDVTNISDSIHYYVRAFAVCDLGTSYGSILSFTTEALPTVTTNPASNVEDKTATINGAAVDAGDCSVVHWGFQWSIHANMSGYSEDVSGPLSLVEFTPGGNFHRNLGGLSNNTTYYFRAIAVCTLGNVTGSVRSFTTRINSTASDTSRAFFLNLTPYVYLFLFFVILITAIMLSLGFHNRRKGRGHGGASEGKGIER